MLADCTTDIIDFAPGMDFDSEISSSFSSSVSRSLQEMLSGAGGGECGGSGGRGIGGGRGSRGQSLVIADNISSPRRCL